MAGSWRYLAQNLVTGAWVHSDLPLREVALERAVSAPGGIDAVIAPEVLDLRAPDGGPLLVEWQTAIYAEREDGTIHNAGLFVRAQQEDDGEQWTIECPGFTVYPSDQPFGGDINRWDADPFQVVRDIWAFLQSQPRGNIGMTVDQHVSEVKASPAKPPKKPGEKAAALKKPTKGAKPKKKAGESTATYNARVAAWERAYKSKLAAYEAARKARDSNKARLDKQRESWEGEYGDRKAYELSWWEAPDCGAEIDRLATEIPFDYLEEHRWADDSRRQVLHHLRLAQPRIGRRRPDLRFAVGENVVVVPDTENDGDEYANGIVGLGKGEGRKMLRVEVSRDDGRLRRVRAVARKDVGTASRLRALANADLQQRIAMGGLAELEVISHPNAPLGSWSLGDEVALVVTMPGWREEAVWCRIVSEVVRPDTADRITLTVVNAERAVA